MVLYELLCVSEDDEYGFLMPLKDCMAWWIVSMYMVVESFERPMMLSALELKMCWTCISEKSYHTWTARGRNLH